MKYKFIKSKIFNMKYSHKEIERNFLFFQPLLFRNKKIGEARLLTSYFRKRTGQNQISFFNSYFFYTNKILKATLNETNNFFSFIPIEKTKKKSLIQINEYFNQRKILKEEQKYSLQISHRSNQDTYLVQKPAVLEGDWVQTGDLLTDCEGSVGGELALGHNILIAYMPWEGFNYEDAMVISQRLVDEDIYTSVHIEKYEIEIRETKFGSEQITKQIPEIDPKELNHLNENGISELGALVKEGDILVGKITPTHKKYQSAYQKFIYTLLEKQFLAVRDSSLRVPKGLKAKVIHVEFLNSNSIIKKNQKKNNLQRIHIYLAEKRKIQVGDKMSGRHGNKGILSLILPKQDLPYLPDGTPVEMILNPLGVPSRMNVGQIYECLLGLSGKYLGENFKIFPFDEIYGAEASRSFVYYKLYEARKKTGKKWLFNPNNPGKIHLFDGRTGECFDQPVTVGQAYMLKLVHLVDEKIHCLTPDHDVLTERGWIAISEVQTTDKVATLNSENQLVYAYPTKVWHYDDYDGKLYHVENQQIHLTVTMNHRMWVSTVHTRKKIWSDYKFIEAQELIRKHVKYLKSAEWVQSDFQFYLPNSDVVLPMDEWLLFFGLWIAEGWTTEVTNRTNYGLTQIAQTKLNVCDKLHTIIQALGFKYRINRKKFILNYQPLYQYLKNYTVEITQITSENHQNELELTDKILQTQINNQIDVEVNFDSYQLQYSDFQDNFYNKSYNKKFPNWVWKCSQRQCRILLEGLVLGDGSIQKTTSRYYTTSPKLADDVMRLALHAGWSGNIYKQRDADTLVFIKGRQIIAARKCYRVGINKAKNKPAFHHGHHKKQKIQQESIYPYQGSVFCLEVPNGVFMVRNKGKGVWTGNSRSTGPYSLVTQQPLRGRSKHGGQRLGEMEVWALEAYGAAFTLLEMLTIKSDDLTGRITLWSNIILQKEIAIGTPESFKVLVCELQALCLDIGLFRLDSKGFLKKIEHLMLFSN